MYCSKVASIAILKFVVYYMVKHATGYSLSYHAILMIWVVIHPLSQVQMAKDCANKI